MAILIRLTEARRAVSSIAGIFTILGMLATLASISGCSIHIRSSHEPMHPLTEPLVIKATAKGYVHKIDLYMEKSRIGASGEQVVFSPMRIVNTCDPLFWKRSLTCFDVIAEPNGRHEDGVMIKFMAIATSPLGDTATETYEFASGAYPNANKPIPIRVKGDPVEKFDIVLIRTNEFDLEFFRHHLDDIIEESFFQYSTFRDWRMFYNFYYSDVSQPYEEPCAFNGPFSPKVPTFPNAFVRSLLTDADVIAYLHEDEMEDCRKEERFSAEFWFDKSIVHEAGHALFGLRDEYYGGLGPQCVGPRNVWHSEAECLEDAHANQLEEGYCKPRGSTLSWKFDQEGPDGCIMNGRSTQWRSGSDFGPACRHRIYWHMGNCLAGECLQDVMCVNPRQ